MSSPPQAAPVAVDTAVGLLEQGRVLAVVEAVREGVARLSDEQVGVLSSVLAGVQAACEGARFALAGEADSRGVIASSTATGTAQWVQDRAAEAGVAVTASVAGGYRKVIDATRLPGYALLKDATTQGRVPVAGAVVVVREFEKLRGRIHAEAHDPALAGLIEYAAGGASERRLGELRDIVLSQYGTVVDYQEECDRRAAAASMSGFRRTRFGMYAARVELDPESVAVVEAALTALSAPTPSAEGFCDVRSPGKRRADALVEVCSVVATNPGLLDGSAHTPDNAQPGRAARAKVVVTLPYAWLSAQVGSRAGYGTTEADQPLPAGVARRLACDAQIIPLVLGSASEPLDVGRATRLATPAQRAALARRDRGCTFPGCDRPPGWCDAHHLIPWEAGGPTDLGNLALLCGRHHIIVHRDHLVGTIEPTRDAPDEPRVHWRRRPPPSRPPQ